MSDIALIMNALLGVLLVGALLVGWRLEQRLKALRASHQSFTEALGDLDRAAARAEQGLADLRAATDAGGQRAPSGASRSRHARRRRRTKLPRRLATPPSGSSPNASAPRERRVELRPRSRRPPPATT